MSKHTPGPWKREGLTVYALMSAGWLKGKELFKNRFWANLVCDASCSKEEAEANARLIAAAPELLEALTTGAQMNLPDFLEWIAARLVKVHGEDPYVDYVQTLRHRAKLCREAIAKATGDGA